MRISFLFLALLLASLSASADGQVARGQFTKVQKGEKMDLLQEGNTLRLNQEDTVQTQTNSSPMYVGILAGAFQPTSLTAYSNGQKMAYDFNQPLPLVTFQFSHFIWNKKGMLGWSGSIGYSYSQYQDISSTALHIVPVELNAIYRAEFTSTQKLIPYVMAGPTLWTYFQRGLDEFNTSQSTLFGSASLGLAFNLNRLKILSTKNDTELLLQYQRSIGPTGTNTNFNGDTLQIGGTIAL